MNEFVTLRAPIVALFLAGGRGTRYAQEKPGANKLLEVLPDGSAVFERALGPYLETVDEMIAVVASADAEILPHLRRDGVRTVIAPDAHLGMGHSLAAGAREALYRFPNLAGVVVGLADMPWLRAETVACVVRALREGTHDAVRVKNSGRFGHPVGFFAPQVLALTTLTGDAGARNLLERGDLRLRYIDVPDAGCLLDVDRPNDIG
jgi:molybdenum cofactor cytidylyltransferase